MGTILVVDDDPAGRDLLVTLLGYRGHRVLTAPDGVRGLEALRAEAGDPVCLVISDILMPAMDGYELVRQLRADPATALTPVIFYSASYHQYEAHALAGACGVQRLLHKPAEPEEILRAVGEALAGGDAPPAAPPPLSEEFDRDHLRLLTDRLAREVEKLEVANRKLAALLELTQQLALERDPQRLLEQFCHAARDLLGARHAALSVVGHGDATRRVFITSGLSAEDAARVAEPAPEDGPLGELLHARRTIRRHVSGPDALGFAAPLSGATEFLGATVASPTFAYGWLCFLGKLGEGEFTEEDERLAGILAAQVGRVYENGILYADLLRHTTELDLEIHERVRAEDALRLSGQRLQTLHEIDRAILQAHSPEEIAQAALTRLGKLVSCRTSVVMEFVTRENEALVLAVLGGDGRLWPGRRLALGGAAVLLELRRGRPLGWGELPAASPLRDLLAPENRTSAVILPLLSQGELLGALHLEVGGGPFSADLTDIAREVSDSVAVAIQQARLFEQIRAGRERLRLLSGQLLRAQETERRSIARELHDEIGQALTALRINLQALQRGKAADLKPRLDESLSIVDRTLQQVRDLSLDLRPSMLDDLGLQAALRWYLDRVGQRAGLAVQFVAGAVDTPLPPELQTVCFRVAQEALTNVVRHARASKVRVEMRLAGAELELLVLDDGAGFDVRAAMARATRGGSLGLLGVRERVTLLGGRIALESSDKGTEVRVWLPLRFVSARSDPDFMLPPE
jgi:signal transduction histidine kinase/DNA-binding response OmpR family regulator